MKWTDRQTEAIQKKGVNLLVSAAAGSGKTAVLVERIKRIILEEGVGVDEMLVVTFTNAAASEMKEKIRASLNHALLEGAADREKTEHLRRQLALLGRANISTFHSFALEIVRRYYHVSGKPPNLTLCDETRQSILKEEALDELFEDMFESGDAGFIDLMDRYATAKSRETVRELILSLYRFLQSLPDPWDWAQTRLRLQEAEPLPQAEDPVVLHLAQRMRRSLAWIVAYLTKAGEVLAAVENERGEPCLSALASKNDQDRAVFLTLLAQAEQGRLSEVQSTLVNGVSFTQMRPGAAEKPYYDEDTKALVSGLRGAAKKKRDKLVKLWQPEDLPQLPEEYRKAQPVLETLIRLVEDFHRRYAEKKLRKNLLDFSDIEHFALEILENQDVCAEYRARFRFIFIDEYQDSNAVQDALIRRICRPDNLFMVGDVKQSIYKFRLAEPELFIEKYLSYRTGRSPESCALDLNSNFRSKAGIIDLVNRVFSRVMHPEATGLAYDSEAALVKGSSYSGPCDDPPILYLVDTGEGDGEEPVDPEIADLKATELEAIQAAAILREHLGALIHDDRTGRERPLGYRDMAILMRAVRGNGEIFYRALADAGIPVYLERNEGYFDTLEIQIFLNLLRLIDNRKQDIPLLSVLRSPLFGFSADDLAAVRIWCGRSDPGKTSYNEAFLRYARSGPEGSLKDRCEAFLDKLEEWRDQAIHRPLDDFLWSLMIDTQYKLFAGAIPGGTQRQANLRALVDKAASYQRTNFGGLYGFIRHIEFLAEKTGRVDTGQADVQAEDSDAVRIMTIHKSKGLEFPFVLLAGLAKDLKVHSNRLPLAYHKELGLGLRLTDQSRGLYADTLAYRMINDRNGQEDLAEWIRILYVAMTRPKDRLALLAAVGKPGAALQKAKAALPGDVESAASYLDMILPATDGALCVKIAGRAALSQARDQEQAERQQLRTQLEQGFSKGTENLSSKAPDWLRYLAEPLPSAGPVQEPVKLTVSQLVAMEADDASWGRRLASEDPEEEGWESREEAGPFVFQQPLFLAGQERLTAGEKGTAYHNVLEHIPLSAQFVQREAVEAFIEGLIGKGILTRQEGVAVDPEKISAFFRSAIGQRILAAQEVHREASFVMQTDLRGTRRLVQGTIDCYFREGDRWILVDYKSNWIDKSAWQAEKERLSRSYQVQMRLYKEALEKITKMPVREAVLYLLAAEEQLTMNY